MLTLCGLPAGWGRLWFGTRASSCRAALERGPGGGHGDRAGGGGAYGPVFRGGAAARRPPGPEALRGPAGSSRVRSPARRPPALPLTSLGSPGQVSEPGLSFPSGETDESRGCVRVGRWGVDGMVRAPCWPRVRGRWPVGSSARNRVPAWRSRAGHACGPQPVAFCPPNLK